MPKLRAKAVMMVRSGVSIRQTAKYFGYQPGTVCKWVHKAHYPFVREIPTQTSAPKTHPNQISQDKVAKIVFWRKKTKRCAEVIREYLQREDIFVSLKTIKRTLQREGLVKPRSPWKRWHSYPEKPLISHPGDLVQVDTIHLMKNERKRIYIFTLIDLWTRIAFARAYHKPNPKNARLFVWLAQQEMGFDFRNIQSDHGLEFSTQFTERVHIPHRHSRIRKPTDNGCLERFNRTIQEECLDGLPRSVRIINKELKRYLRYYNQERLHLSLGLRTPAEKLQECFQGAG